jgi:predicted dehydrogenase
LIEENILIIGSGNRVRRNFLPALFCLKKIYNINILGVFSRNFLNAKKASEEWGLNPLSSEIDLLKLDLTIVIVSITNSNLLSILLKLEKYKKK